MNIGVLFFFFPFFVWAVGIGAIALAVKGNFSRERKRQGRQPARTSYGTAGRVSAQRPQMEKGLFDMDLNRKSPQKDKKTVSFGPLRNTGYDKYEVKGRRKDLVTGYNKKLKDSPIQMRRAQGMQYSHTYDGHEPWDKCLPKEKDPWDPDFCS